MKRKAKRPALTEIERESLRQYDLACKRYPEFMRKAMPQWRGLLRKAGRIS